MSIENLKCEDCGEEKPDVKSRGDSEYVLCDDCLDNYPNETGYCSISCKISGNCDGVVKMSKSEIDKIKEVLSEINEARTMSIENLKKILESERTNESKQHMISEGDNGNAEISYEAGSKAMENRLLPLLQKAVEMAEFYANKDNWTINEDYDGFIHEGWITSEDIEYPPKIPNTFSGYGYGGKKAREFLTNVSEFTEGMLSLSETTESVSEFTKMTEIKKESL